MGRLLTLLLVLSASCQDEAAEPAGPCAAGCREAGSFRVGWSEAGGLVVVHSDAPERVLLASPAERPLVEVERATESVEAERGSFEFEDHVETTCAAPEYDGLAASGDGWQLSGRFGDCDGLAFTLDLLPQSERHLAIELRIDSGQDAGGYNRVRLRWASDPEEAFLGFGAQYGVLNPKGRVLPIWCQEQGHGRGLEPLSTVLGATSGNSAGAWHTSYSCVPLFVTNRGRALLVENTEYLEFDLRADDDASVRVFSRRLIAQVVYGATPLDQLKAFSDRNGRMAPLPAWTQTGPILRSHGGPEEARRVVRELREAGGQPAALWIEDWPGVRQTLFGARMWWNWVPDEGVYPDWPGLVRELREDGVRVLTYFNTFLADAADKPGVQRNLYAEALGAGYLVRGGDGEPLSVDQGGFSAAMVDLTNPDAWGWLSDLLVGQMELGVSGWMADYAEALAYDAQLHSGEDARSYHNVYPQEWARLNREAAIRAGVDDDFLFFNRSGAALSPSWARAFWIGDQLVSWDEYDGLRTVIPALLSSGLSGWSINHSDTGGYLSLELGPDLTYVRSKELFQRWLELSTFTSLLRLHASNRPDSNHQWDTDEETKAHFVRMCAVFAAFAGYREGLFDDAHEHGWPVVRHLLLHYPDDPKAWEQTQQFLLGEDFLVAPVVHEGATSVEVYLPMGRWVQLWSGEVYGTSDGGTALTVEAPVGRPAVFYREGAAAAEAVVELLDEEGLR